MKQETEFQTQQTNLYIIFTIKEASLMYVREARR